MVCRILVGDAREQLATLADGSVSMCVTSPPYFSLRSYLPAGHPDKALELGGEPTPEAYVESLVSVFREVRRVLHRSGVLIVNLGDSYAGSGKGPTGHNGIGDQDKRQGFAGGSKGARMGSVHGEAGHTSGVTPPIGYKTKDQMLTPFMVAEALRADGWYLRSWCPWLKRNCMPESVRDRPTNALEVLFLFSKGRSYFWDADAIRQGISPVTMKQGGYDANGQRPWPDNRSATPSDLAVDTFTGNMRPGRAISINPAGRAYRNSDPWFASLDAAIADAKAELARLVAARDAGGYLLGDDGLPLMADVNPAAFSGTTKTTKRVRVSSGGSGDDTERIASPDCPVHGDRPASTSLCDEPLADPQSHTGHSGTDLFPARPAVNAPIADPSSAVPVPLLSADPAANPHNTPSNRTGRHAATIPAYTASEGIPGRTDGIPVLPDDGSPHLGMDESSRPEDSASNAITIDRPAQMDDCIAGTQIRSSVVQQPASSPDLSNTPHTSANKTASDASLTWEKIPTDTTDTSSCTCSYYQSIITETSHYAAYPPSLIAPLIKAGSSEKGVCGACGEPWKRTTERDQPPRVAPSGIDRFGTGEAGVHRKVGGQYQKWLDAHPAVTVGWAAGCACDAGEPRPSVVLDPFAGAGTTLLVSERLGRDSIGVELNEEYSRLALDRIESDAPMFAAVERPAAPAQPVGLFESEAAS